MKIDRIVKVLKRGSKALLGFGGVAAAGALLFHFYPLLSAKFTKSAPAGSLENSDKMKKMGQGKASPSVAARDLAKQQASQANSPAGAVVPAPTRTVPLAATPLNTISPEEKKRFPGAKVVSSAEVAGPGAGQVTRVRILETDFKYPFLRTEEVVDQASGQVVSREEMVANHVLVTLRDGEDPGSLITALGGTDIQLEQVSPDAPLYRLHLGAAALETVPAALDALDECASMVQTAEPDFVRQGLLVPNDPKYLDGTLWGLNQASDVDIDAPEGWDTRAAAGTVIVAVVDTGVRHTHQDLAANMWRNPNEIAGNGVDDDANGWVDDVYGCDAYNRDGDPMDDQGHGTHCAGTIGGVGNNGVGVAGVAWGVKIMAGKFLSATGSGTDSDAVTCIDYARLKGAKVLSCSWGGGGAGASLSAAIDRARAAGIIVVAAAGNEASNNDALPSYPANYPQDNIVSVAASTRNDGLASFSNYGSTTVDLAAPGEGIYSTVSSSDSAYATYSGTSMATPHVSGVVALLAAQYPTDLYTGLIQRLLNGVDSVPALVGKTRSGRLNLVKALGATNNPTPVRPVNDNFASPTVASGITWANSGSNVSGTSESGEPAHAGQTPAKSVWFVWTAPSSGRVTMGTAGSTFDTVLAVYTGGAIGSLTSIASNDNRTTGATDSQVTFQAVAGTTYRIAIDGKSGAFGSLRFSGNLAGPAVANDAFASAVLCSGSAFTVTGSNVGATKEAGEPSHAGLAGGKSVWWTWTAPASGKLTLVTAGSSYDTVLAVYTGDAVNGLRAVAFNDDASWRDLTSKVNFSVSSGVRYRIAVDGYNAAAGAIKLAGTFAATKVLVAPLGVIAKQDVIGRIQIKWQPVPKAVSYDVALRSGFNIVASGRVTATTARSVGTFPQALPMTAIVRAISADGAPGLWSGEKPVAK
jgi:subtilisin family serine protease